MLQLTQLGVAVFLSLFSLSAFGQAWRPLLKRWSSGDYSVMQPSEPNATPLVFMTLTKASADIGALEKTLLGASSFGLGGAALDRAEEALREA